MNNTQLYLSIGIPTVTVILAWLLNRADITRLDAKIGKLGDALRGEMIALRRDIGAEMIGFRKDVSADIGSLRKNVSADIGSLRKDISAEMIGFRKEVHGDLLMLHERVVTVEVRQGLES